MTVLLEFIKCQRKGRLNKVEAIKLPEWKELLEVALTWEYGSIHSHEEIAKIMYLNPLHNKYYQMVRRANEELIDKGKMLVNVNKVGYQVVKPDEYLNVATKTFVQGKRRIHKANRILTFAPTELMTEGARKSLLNVRDRIQAFDAYIQGGVKEVKLLQKPMVKINSGRD